LAKQFCGWARAAKRFQGAMGKKLGRTANRVEQACEQGVQLVQPSTSMAILEPWLYRTLVEI
jgi:hypothetical protein